MTLEGTLPLLGSVASIIGLVLSGLAAWFAREAREAAQLARAQAMRERDDVDLLRMLPFLNHEFQAYESSIAPATSINDGNFRKPGTRSARGS